jgi:putative hemolysin
MKRMIFTSALLVFFIVLTSCTALQTQPTPAPVSTDTPQANMPNPASAFCVEQGFKSEIRTAADGSQSGVCIFPDGSECDDWAYFRGECAPASQSESTSSPTEIPTPLPIDPADYQGWWIYTHAVYGFSIMLPEDWAVDETTTFDPLMNGHTLMLHSQPTTGVNDLNIRMTFRRVGEDVLLWPTGVGAGQFIQQGTLDVAGQPARRILFVCPTGQVNEIWYHNAEESQPNITRGDMEFGFILSLTGFYCEEGHSLGGKIQRVGEMIIASLKVP